MEVFYIATKKLLYGTKEDIRILCRTLYQMQKLRIQIGNRIVADFNRRLGQEPSEKQEDEKVLDMIEVLRKEFKRITDAYVVKKTSISEEITLEKGLIASEMEYEIIRHYMGLLKNEEDIVKSLAKIVETQPIWIQFLAGIKGCGPASAGILISELDPYKARHASSYWKYAGLDVVIADNKGRSAKKEHLEEREYMDSEGETKTKLGITYNPFLKTKLLGVMGDVFIKMQNEYTKFYYDYKNRMNNRFGTIIGYDKKQMPKYSYIDGMTAMHIHRMAVRYMMKQFLRDLWVKQREIEGLEVTLPYEVQYLGKPLHGYNRTVEGEEITEE